MPPSSGRLDLIEKGAVQTDPFVLGRHRRHWRAYAPPRSLLLTHTLSGNVETNLIHGVMEASVDGFRAALVGVLAKLTELVSVHAILQESVALERPQGSDGIPQLNEDLRPKQLALAPIEKDVLSTFFVHFGAEHDPRPSTQTPSNNARDEREATVPQEISGKVKGRSNSNSRSRKVVEPRSPPHKRVKKTEYMKVPRSESRESTLTMGSGEISDDDYHNDEDNDNGQGDIIEVNTQQLSEWEFEIWRQLTRLDAIPEAIFFNRLVAAGKANDPRCLLGDIQPLSEDFTRDSGQ